MLQKIIFIKGSILGFFDFGTSISRQSISVLTIIKDLKGLRVLANKEAILVKLSLICSSGKAKGVRGARGTKGQRFCGIFSFNISYLRRESQWRSSARQCRAE